MPAARTKNMLTAIVLIFATPSLALKHNSDMKASSARDIVFAHALETAAAHEALPTAERCTAITQECLHAQGKTRGGGRAAFESFLQERAQRVIAAAQLPADIRAMARQRAGISRWMVLAVMAAAFALGFAGHAITDPHRVDLLSASLIGIVLWNLLVYALLLLTWLRSLLRRRKMVIAPLQRTGSGALGQRRWLAAEAAGKEVECFARHGAAQDGAELRAQLVAGQPAAAPCAMACVPASGAAMLALGALASLWLTGLTRAYQVGWESTFLSPSAVQTCLNLLFAPVQHLLGLAPWSLAQIQALQGWSAGDAADAGPRWVQLYSWLLGLMVVAPRLLLALWQGARVWWLSQHLALPLQQPYFQKLQRDWAGRATALLVQPYSLDITPEREATLRNHVAQSYGAGAQLALLPVLAYGSPLPDASAVDAQQVLLLNLAATPEAEIHGVLLAQVLNRWGAQTDVWLWAADFRARNSGAPARVQEREQLWREFVRSAGLNATLVPGAGVS